MVESFCTPLGDQVDDRLLAHFCDHVRGFVSDKALQKVGDVLKRGAMQNIMLLARDPAHMIRIACMKPLNTIGRFEAQYERLFDGRHALFKDDAIFNNKVAFLLLC